MLVISLTYAELASAMPEVGGEHAYSLRALGWSGSFFCTWSLVLGYASVGMFEAVALPTALEYLFPQVRAGYLWTVAGSSVHLSFVLIGMTGGVLMTGLNIAGVRFAAVVQTAVVTVVLVIGGLFLFGAAAYGDPARLSPSFASEGRGFLGVLLMTPTLFGRSLLVWPYEWFIVGSWVALGTVMGAIARLQHGGPGTHRH